MSSFALRLRLGKRLKKIASGAKTTYSFVFCQQRKKPFKLIECITQIEILITLISLLKL